MSNELDDLNALMENLEADTAAENAPAPSKAKKAAPKSKAEVGKTPNVKKAEPVNVPAKKEEARKLDREGNEILPGEEHWTPAERSARKKKAHKYAPGETRFVILQTEKGEGGNRHVPVSYNGHQYLVPRGVKTEVPAPVAEILKNAEELIVEWDGHNEFIQRSAPAYPASISDE